MKNESHFKNIYEQYKNLVFNLSLQYVLNSADAEDITQEVFVKVYQRFHQFNSQKSSLRTWICRIAINSCLDFLKTKKTKKRFGLLSSIFQHNSNEPISEVITIDHPGIGAEHKEALHNLLRIIYALPENQKTAIILSKMEDRSQKEVADIMQISVKAVESLLQRAKQTIQKKLAAIEGI